MLDSTVRPSLLNSSIRNTPKESEAVLKLPHNLGIQRAQFLLDSRHEMIVVAVLHVS